MPTDLTFTREGTRKKALARIDESRAIFEEAVAAARLFDLEFARILADLDKSEDLADDLHPSGARDREVRAKLRAVADAGSELQRRAAALAELTLTVRADFAAIEAKVCHKGWSRWTNRQYVDQAEGLARSRVYVLPAHELTLEAQSKFNELEQWKIPAPVLDGIRTMMEKVTKPPRPAEGDGQLKTKAPDLEAERVQRAALLRVLEDYDYWNTYIDWYFVQQAITATALIFLASVSIYFSWLFLKAEPTKPWTRGWGFAGFVLAGVCGASVSVAIKLPPVSVYGDVPAFWVRTLARMAAGVIASALGFAMVSSNLINLKIGDAQLQNVVGCCIDAKARDASPADKPDARAPPAPEKAGSDALDGGAPDGGAHTPEVKAKDAPAPPPVCEAGKDPCPPRWSLLLLALGILFGFSERALTSFEEAIFGKAGEAKSGGGK
jgi:hypothetical protein